MGRQKSRYDLTVAVPANILMSDLLVEIRRTLPKFQENNLRISESFGSRVFLSTTSNGQAILAETARLDEYQLTDGKHILWLMCAHIENITH